MASLNRLISITPMRPAPGAVAQVTGVSFILDETNVRILYESIVDLEQSIEGRAEYTTQKGRLTSFCMLYTMVTQRNGSEFEFILFDRAKNHYQVMYRGVSFSITRKEAQALIASAIKDYPELQHGRPPDAILPALFRVYHGKCNVRQLETA